MSDGSHSVQIDSSRVGGPVAWLAAHRLAAGFLLLNLLHAPTLWAYGSGLASLDHYQFFPVVWIALLVLVFTRGSSVLVPRWYHAGLLVMDAMCLVAAALYRSPWLGYVGFCAGCLALLWAGRDRTTGRSLWPLILLPLMTLRPPLNLDTQIITGLQRTTTQAASAIIDRMGVLHHCRGVVLELPDRQLFIDEACSGIHSLFTLLGLATLIILVFRRHWLASLILLASAVVWALLLNVVRVVTIVLADLWLGVDVASGWQHDVLGFVLVGIALVCLLSTDRLLVLVFSRIPRENPDFYMEAEEENLLVRVFNWFFRPPVRQIRTIPDQSSAIPMPRTLGASFAVVAVLLITAQAIGLQPRLDVGSRTTETLALDGQTLAERYDGWIRGDYETEQRGTESMWGPQSSTWNYAGAAHSARVCLDYPFTGWHELTDCYRNTGWQIDRREVRRGDAVTGDWPLVVVVMQDETGQHAALCYSLFDRDGNPVLPAWDQLTDSVVNRWKYSTGQLIRTYQVQTLARALAPPREEELDRLVQLHCDARRDLVRAVAGVKQ